MDLSDLIKDWIESDDILGEHLQVTGGTDLIPQNAVVYGVIMRKGIPFDPVYISSHSVGTISVDKNLYGWAHKYHYIPVAQAEDPSFFDTLKRFLLCRLLGG